jgi:hypothetical protein
MCSLAAYLLVANYASAADNWDRDWRVVTLASDGAFGLGIDTHIAGAAAIAIRKCREMSTASGDCGAELVSTRSGWVLGLLCGDHKFLVSGHDLKEAEMAALHREIDLKNIYVPNLPSCHRVLTLDPARQRRSRDLPLCHLTAAPNR